MHPRWWVVERADGADFALQKWLNSQTNMEYGFCVLADTFKFN